MGDPGLPDPKYRFTYFPAWVTPGFRIRKVALLFWTMGKIKTNCTLKTTTCEFFRREQDKQ